MVNTKLDDGICHQDSDSAVLSKEASGAGPGLKSVICSPGGADKASGFATRLKGAKSTTEDDLVRSHSTRELLNLYSVLD